MRSIWVGLRYVFLDILIWPYWEKDLLERIINLLALAAAIILGTQGLQFTTTFSVENFGKAILWLLFLAFLRMCIFAYKLHPYKEIIKIAQSEPINPQILQALVPRLPAEQMKRLIRNAAAIENNSGVKALWELEWLENDDDLGQAIRKRVTDICSELVKVSETGSYCATETCPPSQTVFADRSFRNEISRLLTEGKTTTKKRLLILDWCTFLKEFELIGTSYKVGRVMKGYIAWHTNSETTLYICVVKTSTPENIGNILERTIGSHNTFWNFAIYGDNLVFAENQFKKTIRIFLDKPDVATFVQDFDNLLNKTDTVNAHTICTTSGAITNDNDLETYINSIKDYYSSIECTATEDQSQPPHSRCAIGKYLTTCPTP